MKGLTPWWPGKLVIQYRRTDGKKGNGLAGPICKPVRTESVQLVMWTDAIIITMLQGKYAR